MSRVEKLIAQLAPNGVPVKMLGDIAELVRGSGMPKADLTDNGVGAIHYGQIYTRYGAWATDTISFVAPEAAARLVEVQPGDIIITNTSENTEDVCKAVAWLGDEPIVTGGHATVIKHSQDPKYLSYWFQSQSFYAQKRTLATGTKVMDVSAKQLMKVRIPVPPLEVQREIVKVLDRFTQLEAELEAELAIRVQQRLAFASAHFGFVYSTARQVDHPTRVRLGDVATQYIEPVRVEAEETYENLGLRWYGSGVFARDSKRGSAIKAKTLYRVKSGLFIYNRMFVVEGSFGIVTPDLAQGVVSNEFPAYELDSNRVLGEWLLHYLLDEYTLKRVAAEVTGVERGSMKSRRRWKEDQFEAFEIDLPSVDTQREVVRVLGTFSELESALREELAERRKQYEYYRDKLLNFEELMVEQAAA